MHDLIDKFAGWTVIFGVAFFCFGLFFVLVGGMMLIEPAPYYQFRWWGL